MLPLYYSHIILQYIASSLVPSLPKAHHYLTPIHTLLDIIIIILWTSSRRDIDTPPPIPSRKKEDSNHKLRVALESKFSKSASDHARRASNIEASIVPKREKASKTRRRPTRLPEVQSLCIFCLFPASAYPQLLLSRPSNRLLWLTLQPLKVDVHSITPSQLVLLGPPAGYRGIISSFLSLPLFSPNRNRNRPDSSRDARRKLVCFSLGAAVPIHTVSRPSLVQIHRSSSSAPVYWESGISVLPCQYLATCARSQSTTTG